MEHLKMFEGELLDNLDQKAKEYEKYTGKFVVLQYDDNLFLAKFISIVLNGYYAKIENYEWDRYYKGYVVDKPEPIHLSEINILDSFDSTPKGLKDAKLAYERALEAEKYNL